MRVEVVYHQADSLDFRVEIVEEVAHHFGELQLSAVLGDPHLSSALEGGSKAMSTLAIPLRSYSESARCGLPGLRGSDSRTSANSWQGLSSKHTTGLFGS
jgi:hypothetical protein